jgi:hypothetical protein
MKNIPAGNHSKMIKMINPTMGEDAGKEASLSEDNWGSQTQTYLQSIHNIHNNSFPKIVVWAQGLAKISCHAGDFTMSGPSVDLDEHALLVDIADD